MLMSLFKWQSRILNNLYKTQQFTKLQQQGLSDPEQIDYSEFYKMSNLIKKNQSNQLIDAANVLCRPSTSSVIMQKQVMRLNKIIQQISQYRQQKKHTQTQLSCEFYQMEHVIAYSCLSKCRIWPKVLKSGQGFVPSLIAFYNQFTKDFNQYLDFKFDPIILSQKYTKIMKKVHTKKKDNPEAIEKVLQNNPSALVSLLLEKQILKDDAQQIINCLTQDQKKTLPQIINNIVHNNMAITHIAVKSSSKKFIQFLGKIGADFQTLDGEKQTALFYAVKRADIQILSYLIQDLKVNVNARQYQKRTPFYLAAFQGFIDVVDFLYKHGADPQLPSKLQRTPLSKACYLGNVQVVQYLLKLKVDLLKRDVKGRTALHNAVWGIEGGRDGKRRGHIKLQDSPQCAELMIEAGHPIDFVDYDGFTPLFSAVSSRANRSLEILIKYGASLTHITNKQQTCVFIAAKYGHLETLKLLIENFNCEYLKTDIHGYTPLCASITLSSSDVFCYISDLHLKNNNPLNLNKLLQCCLQYDRLQNWSYIWQWLGLQRNDKKPVNHLPWLKKNAQIIPNIDKPQQSHTQYFLKLDHLLKQLKQSNYFIPLIKNLRTNNNLKKTDLGIQFDQQYSKTITVQEQITQDYEDQQTNKKQTQQLIQEKKQMDQLVISKFIDPAIKTNIKASVPTISIKLPSARQIQSHMINFLNSLIMQLFGKQSKLTEKQQRYFVEQIGLKNFQQFTDCLTDHYCKIKSSSSIIDGIILMSRLVNKYKQLLQGQISINNFQISSKVNQKDIIKIIFNCEGNLTYQPRNIIKMLMRVVKYRMTGVIFAIYNNINDFKDQNSKKGIKKYTKIQLLEMLVNKNYDKHKKGKEQQIKYQQTQQKLSLIQYCLINGISDIYVYLRQILKINGFNFISDYELKQQYQYQKNVVNILSVKIPDYYAQRVQYTQQEANYDLEPVQKWVFDYQQLMHRMSDKEKYIYKNILKTDLQKAQNCLFDSNQCYQVITTFSSLKTMEQEIQPHLIVGIDTEYWGNKNEHFICSIQIAVCGKVYILDPLSTSVSKQGDELSQQQISIFMKKLFANKNKIKIFHAYENDMKWLNQDYRLSSKYNDIIGHEQYKLQNIVDTGRIYSCLHSSKKKTISIGLKSLSKTYLNYNMSKDFQQSDWRIRPLFREMIQYAAIDAQILPYIFIRQIIEKKKKQIESSKVQESLNSEQKSFEQIQKSIYQVFQTKRTFKSRGVGYKLYRNELIDSDTKIHQDYFS